MKTVMKTGVRPAPIEYEVVDGGLALKRRSDMTGKLNERTILGLTEDQLKQWCAPDGPLIQDVMPKLGSEDREFLISGCTPEEWAEIDEEE